MPRFFKTICLFFLLSSPLLAQKAILDQTSGDLNGDGSDERIVIYSIPVDSSDSEVREVHIFEKKDSKWVLWKQFRGGVLPATKGIAPKDAYVSMEVENGQLILYHAHSDQDQWNYSHHFRLYQEQMELVQAKISFGALCEGFTHIDFDLLTGLLSYKRETDNCTAGEVNQVLIDKKELVYLEELPLLSGFVPGDNEIKVPGTDLVFYY